MFHAGHLESLKYAKKLGDILIVGVNSDASIQALKGPNRPIIPLEQRVQILEALECVDYIVPFDTITPEHLLDMIRPHIYVKGAEYAGHEFSAAKYVDMIHLNPMVTGLSTSKIIQKICDTHIQKPAKLPQEATNATNLASYNAIKDIWKK
jgi:D-beta-D-heptose 7-phosphate kinase/D-beta-D-heptose 1-phosphate adenosyltransferase